MQAAVENAALDNFCYLTAVRVEEVSFLGDVAVKRC